MLFYVGIVCCLVAILQVGQLAWTGVVRARKRRRRHAEQKEQFLRQLELAARAARADRPAYRGWQGERPLRVAAIVDETHDVKSFYLTEPDGHPLPRFEPGQYLTLHFDTPPGEKPLVRCYSLSDRHHEEYYRLTIKRCDAPVGHPDAHPGRGSHRLHRYTQVGDLLSVSAPRGGFFLDPCSDRPLVFVAGGIGVTPLVSMLAQLVEDLDDREVYFFYGVRNSENHALRDHLAELAAKRENVHLFVAYSQPLPTDRLHIDYQHAGRLSGEYLRQVLPPGRFDYYLCGPGDMMQSIVLDLLEQGVSDDSLHYEAFGPASIPRRPKSSAAEAVTCPVRLATSDQETLWDGEFDSLLDLLEQAGAPIAAGCRSGNCGLCATRVIEGSFDTVKTPGAPVPSDHCLACISVPTSPLVLDL
jgi:ferredoxin-NADP reductase